MTGLPDNRRAALRLFQAVVRDHKPLEGQAERIGRGLKPQDRAFVRLLVATSLRRLGQIDGILKRCLDRPIPAKLADVRDVLRLGVAQLVYLETPPHAVVDTAVHLVKEGRLSPYAGLTNAVLRRVSRDGKTLSEGLDETRWNTPQWLWMDWVKHYGEDVARAIGAAHLREAPLDLTLKPGEEPALWAEKLGADVLPSGSLRCRSGGMVSEMAGFSDGVWWVQDAAAALAVRTLGDVSGRRVADLCAAPGGKTCQLAAAGADVMAIDRAPHRLRRVRENLSRLRLRAQTHEADAREWRPDRLLDAVLVDAPCSATGTLRRHPDVARLKQAQDETDLAKIQAALLRASAEMVRPGGLVVYCTCSLQRAEGEEQIETALAAGLPFERMPIQASEIGGLDMAISGQGDVRTLPCQWQEHGGLDGFFIARLRRL